ncbi:MAG: prolipoprotein diacylglyceryl transferase [Bacteroidia bacterium]|nr:prolipoprotein diacylglyceryl transferase [Bacteroidia bacterium]MCZ2276879.1 prolipoprotein diacylglyceryl transferase [Bacteroidia bacterium]
MYPTLSDLLYDLFGVTIPLPIQSFGFMLAISFLLAAWTLTLELKRKEQQGLLTPVIRKTLQGKKPSSTDYIFSFIVWFIIGFKLVYIILNYSSFVEDTQGVLLSAKGNILAGLAVAIAGVYSKYRSLKQKKQHEPKWVEEKIHPYQLTGNITMLAAVAGLIGAKIFHNLENLDELISDPVGSLLSFSGLTMYGGLICGTAAVLWYGNKNKISWKPLIDSAAPGLMLAYGTGRIGCHISGDGDWGIVNNLPKPAIIPDWAWAYNYPHNVINEGIPIPGCAGRHCMMLPEAVFPTPLYEAITCIVLFFILWFLRKKIQIPGLLFSIYLIMNGVERFFIEKIRVNTQYHIFGHGITQAEIISVCLFIAGVAGIWYFRKTKSMIAT